MVAEDRQEERADEGDGDGGVDRLLHRILLALPEGAGDDDAGTDEDALEEAGEQHRQTGDRRYGGERLLADKITDHERVDGLIELLEEVSKKDGNCEGDEVPLDGTAGHEL